MRLFTLVVALLVWFAAYSLHANQAGGLIVGGSEARAGEFPFIVSLQGNSGHFCGGSLIAPDVVLTAANCVGWNFKVVIGLHDRNDFSRSEVHSVKRITVHPSYNPGTMDYDFAVVELNTRSAFKPIRINTRELAISDTPGQMTVATAAGWGATSENGSLPSRLRKVALPLVTKRLCDTSYPGKISSRMLCAGYVSGGRDACQGDSGGPLFVRLASGEPLLVGVVSWGTGCARPNKLGIYAKVNAVASWIQRL